MQQNKQEQITTICNGNKTSVKLELHGYEANNAYYFVLPNNEIEVLDKGVIKISYIYKDTPSSE